LYLKISVNQCLSCKILNPSSSSAEKGWKYRKAEAFEIEANFSDCVNKVALFVTRERVFKVLLQQKKYNENSYIFLVAMFFGFFSAKAQNHVDQPAQKEKPRAKQKAFKASAQELI
jgi:hypothetical protein